MAILSIQQRRQSTANFHFYKLACKDFRWKVLGIPIGSSSEALWRTFLEDLLKPPFHKHMLAFFTNSAPATKTKDVTYYVPNREHEFNRMGVNPKAWRVSNVNNNYWVTPTFPSVNRVPASITDEQIKDLAECWTHKRFPVLVWCHPHSKASICRAGGLFVTGAVQPSAPGAPPSPNIQHHNTPAPLIGSVSVGSLPGNLKGESVIIDAISETNPEKSLHIFDTGHQNTALLPNYPRVRFYFLGLAGISELREGYNMLLAMHKRHHDKAWNAAISAHWVDSLRLVLTASVSIVNLVELGESILIQHNDICDVDATLSCLVQIQIDPHYRTIKGFMHLIEKEWLALGHPFATRCSHEFLNKKPDPSAFSPVFVHFLFAVWMIWQQYPTSFAFNEDFLMFLADAVYDCRFGNFLHNSDSERSADSSLSFVRPLSVWGHILKNLDQFRNQFHIPPGGADTPGDPNATPGGPDLTPGLGSISPKGDAPNFEQALQTRVHHSGSFVQLGVGVRVSEAAGFVHSEVIKFDYGICGGLMWNAYFFRFAYSERVGMYTANQRISEEPSTLKANSLSLSTLPSAVYNLANLKTLDITKNYLNQMPIQLSALTSLVKLRMEENQILFLTDPVTYIMSQALTNLKELNLDTNLISVIPESFALFSQLEILSLRNNKLTEFANPICSLPNLRVLRLSGNTLTKMPTTSVKFSQLHILDLCKTGLANLPHSLTVLPSLKELHLSDNLLGSLPLGFSELTSLEILALDGNRLTEFPASILSLTSLRSLNLNNNDIASLPNEIGTLTRLVSLMLDNNKLQALPVGIGQIVKLEVLEFMNNSVTDLPLSLATLGNLKLLRLDGNKIRTPPPEVVAGGLSSILDYLRDLIGGWEPCYRMKIMIVGQENVGKTSLLRSLKDRKKVDTNVPSISTDGIDIHSLTFQGVFEEGGDHDKVVRVKKDITLNVWDFAGQEIYYTTHQFFLSERSIYVVVWNLLEEETASRIEFWLQSINARANGSGVILVGTHADEVQRGTVKSIIKYMREKYCTRFPNIVDIVPVSLSTGKGTQELRTLIEEVVVKQKHMGELVPRNYLWLEKLVADRCKELRDGEQKDGEKEDSKEKDGSTKEGKEGGKEGKEKGKKEKDRDSKDRDFSGPIPSRSSLDLLDGGEGKGKGIPTIPWSQFINLGQICTIKQDEKEQRKRGSSRWKGIPTIQWSQFLNLGQICTIKDESELLRATTFLHNQGTLVYFPKDPGLKDFVILDPQWLTVMLASIITTKHTYAKDGVLPHANLKHIWKPPLYPSYLHPHLMALLEKFEISFNLSKQKPGYVAKMEIDENAKSLIPSLLPSQRPSQVELLWGPPSTKLAQFSRKYKFDFIPNGFFSRLMVRLLNFSHTTALCYWRNGMLLSKGEDQIFMELLPAQQVLNFTVRGPTPGAHVQDIIDTINSMISDLYKIKVTVYVPCIHCIMENVDEPYLFSLEECQDAVMKGKSFVYCHQTRAVSTAMLVPDLAMLELDAIRIQYKDLILDKMIGEGGAAQVYKGIWTGQGGKGKVVAIKKLKVMNDSSSIDVITDVNISKAFDEFRRECWVMSGLEHPNITQLMGLCMDPHLCIVTEFLPYGNLYDFLHNPDNAMDWPLKLKIALDISEGMEFLHGSTPPIIHRDLKTPNVLLAATHASAPVVAKVADFGLSGLENTIADRVVENPVWLAPEIMMRLGFTMQTDIYSYGVILWEIVTRQRYFGDIPFMSEVEKQVLGGTRPPIPQECRENYPRIAALIEACWNNDPSCRPPFVEITSILLQVMRTMPSVNVSSPTLPPHDFPPTFLRSSSSKFSLQSSDSTEDLTPLPSPSVTPSNSFNSVPYEQRAAIAEIRARGNSDAEKVQISHSKRSMTATFSYTTSYVRELTPICSGSVTALALCGTRVWAGCGDGTITIWNHETGALVKTLAGHQRRVYALFPCLTFVWTGGEDAIINVWNSEDFKLVNTFDRKEQISCFVKIDTAIWAGSILNSTISVFNIKKKYKYKDSFDVGTETISCMIRKEKHVWVAAGKSVLWVDPSSRRIIKSLNGHTKTIHSMVEVEDTVWTAGSDRTIRVWALNGDQVMSIEAHASRIFCLLVDGSHVWSGSWDKSIKIWHAKDYRCLKEHTDAHKDAIGAMVLVQSSSSSNNFKTKSVWSGSFDRTIAIWSVVSSAVSRRDDYRFIARNKSSPSFNVLLTSPSQVGNGNTSESDDDVDRLKVLHHTNTFPFLNYPRNLKERSPSVQDTKAHTSLPAGLSPKFSILPHHRPFDPPPSVVISSSRHSAPVARAMTSSLSPAPSSPGSTRAKVSSPKSPRSPRIIPTSLTNESFLFPSSTSSPGSTGPNAPATSESIGPTGPNASPSALPTLPSPSTSFLPPNSPSGRRRAFSSPPVALIVDIPTDNTLHPPSSSNEFTLNNNNEITSTLPTDTNPNNTHTSQTQPENVDNSNPDPTLPDTPSRHRPRCSSTTPPIPNFATFTTSEHDKPPESPNNTFGATPRPADPPSPATKLSVPPLKLPPKVPPLQIPSKDASTPAPSGPPSKLSMKLDLSKLSLSKSAESEAPVSPKQSSLKRKLLTLGLAKHKTHPNAQNGFPLMEKKADPVRPPAPILTPTPIPTPTPTPTPPSASPSPSMSSLPASHRLTNKPLAKSDSQVPNPESQPRLTTKTGSFRNLRVTIPNPDAPARPTNLSPNLSPAALPKSPFDPRPESPTLGLHPDRHLALRRFHSLAATRPASAENVTKESSSPRLPSPRPVHESDLLPVLSPRLDLGSNSPRSRPRSQSLSSRRSGGIERSPQRLTSSLSFVNTPSSPPPLSSLPPLSPALHPSTFPPASSSPP
eukprot:Phypoly_transcript_00022.p1 GENE.Phypoly_transcript_00022~~Phypoly_transcript_00022.p1  ORF type:complete len:3281 (-),score=556.54 Phypoly_transcript_00022:159-8669(-)